MDLTYCHGREVNGASRHGCCHSCSYCSCHLLFIDGAAFQGFVNGFFKVPDGLLFGNKTRQPDHQSKLVEPAGNSQPIGEPEIDPQFIQETGGDSNVTQVTDSKLRNGDEIAG